MEGKKIRGIVSLCINVLLVVVAIVIMYNVGSRGFAFGARVFDEKAIDTADRARQVEVTLPANMTDDKVIELLYNKGLIEDKLVFKAQLMLSDYKGKFKAGTYVLNTSMTPTQIMETISAANDSEE